MNLAYLYYKVAFKPKMKAAWFIMCSEADGDVGLLIFLLPPPESCVYQHAACAVAPVLYGARVELRAHARHALY